MVSVTPNKKEGDFMIEETGMMDKKKWKGPCSILEALQEEYKK